MRTFVLAWIDVFGFTDAENDTGSRYSFLSVFKNPLHFHNMSYHCYRPYS